MLDGVRVTNVMAATLDGKIAASPQETDKERISYGFTNDEDQAHLIDIIKSADAVITGANSLRITQEIAEVRNQKGVYPIWSVLTKSGLEPSLPFWQQKQIEKWVVGPNLKPNLAPKGSENIKIIDSSDKNVGIFLLEKLASAGVEHVVLLGGSQINYEFYQNNLVTDLIITICPFIFGSIDALPLVAPPLTRKVKLTLLTSHVSASHVFLHYRVQD